MHTRRYFLKTVLLGTVAGLEACRRDPSPPHVRTTRATNLGGESFLRCHDLRDGQVFQSIPTTAQHDIVIVGGGPSGMSAAYRLRDLDILLLEKEDQLGGNCLLDEWEGVRMSTGGAFYTLSETTLVDFYKEIGAPGLPVVGGDSLVIDGEPVTDFFRDGADRLPFAQSVRDDFKRSRVDLLKLYETRPEAELDRVSFAELLKPYAPEVRQFWDRFGPSNWGGTTEHTSGYIGAEAYTWAGGAEDPRWTFAGGLGGGAHALASWLTPRLGDRLVTNALVHRIEREGSGPRAGVIVQYLKNGEPAAVRARAVIVGIPKFVASRIVMGLAADQVAAMQAVRYAPYPVFNVCLTSPGPEPAYDNWFLDAPFTDFVPAEWIVYGGPGPRNRKTVLTVYHPLPEARRPELLVDPMVLDMADAVAGTLERHFPGIIDRIAEIRVFRRGHPMFISTPGHGAIAARAAQPFGPIFFANTDSRDGISSFANALDAAADAAEHARKLLTS